MRYRQIIDEVKEKTSLPPQRAAYDIHQMLLNNERLFSGKIDKEDFSVLLRDLEQLGESSQLHQQSPFFKREAEQVFGRLLFYLERIV